MKLATELRIVSELHSYNINTCAANRPEASQLLSA